MTFSAWTPMPRSADDVGACWQALRPHARIADPLQDVAYGMRACAIHDPDGQLRLGQAL